MAAIILALCLPINNVSWLPSADAEKQTEEQKQAFKIRDSIQKETKKMNAKQKQKYYDKVINGIIQEAKKEKTDVRKLIIINDRLAERITYDYDTFENTKKANKESYRKFGAIVNGTAVCNGYMEVLQEVLTKVGFTNKTIIDNKMNHGWNLVKIGKDYYHIDLTWNDGNELQEYEYFLLDDKTIKEKDHGTYKPKKDEKATSKIYLAFSKKDDYIETQKIKDDKSGVYFCSNNEIYMVDYKGKKKVIQTFDNQLENPTYFLGLVNNQLYYYIKKVTFHPITADLEESSYKLVRIKSNNLSKQEVLFSSKENFEYKFTNKEVVTSQYFWDWDANKWNKVTTKFSL